MKARLNITIEESILKQVKAFAASKGLSVSQIIEDYFKTIVDFPSQENIIEMIDQLSPADTPADVNELKKSYYEEKAGTYGI